MENSVFLVDCKGNESIISQEYHHALLLCDSYKAYFEHWSGKKYIYLAGLQDYLTSENIERLAQLILFLIKKNALNLDKNNNRANARKRIAFEYTPLQRKHLALIAHYLGASAQCQYYLLQRYRGLNTGKWTKEDINNIDPDIQKILKVVYSFRRVFPQLEFKRDWGSTLLSVEDNYTNFWSLDGIEKLAEKFDPATVDTLWFNSYPISDFNSDEIKKTFPKLYWLNVRNCAFRKLCPHHLGQGGLGHLNLSANKGLTDIDFDCFKPEVLQKLRNMTIDLREIRFPDEIIKRLQEQSTCSYITSDFLDPKKPFNFNVTLEIDAPYTKWFFFNASSRKFINTLWHK